MNRIALAILLVACGPEQEGSVTTTTTTSTSVTTAAGTKTTSTTTTMTSTAMSIDVEWSRICSSYAEQCPQSTDLARCQQRCTTETFHDHLEMCGFILCGVETQLCDDQEPGDPTIMACMRQKGFLSAG